MIDVFKLMTFFGGFFFLVFGIAAGNSDDEQYVYEFLLTDVYTAVCVISLISFIVGVIGLFVLI